MRTAFIETLVELAEYDQRIWLLTGDLGYSVLEPFAERFPNRFVNVGVAEQNMTGVAAGLALSGRVVFMYSIANFPTLRCLEHVRNDICYHNLDVKIVSVGGGVVYGAAGYTHHAVEDLAIMSVLPAMTVLAPADPIETRLTVRAMVKASGPCYLRLGKAGEPALHRVMPDLKIGKAIVMRQGNDITLISTGTMLKNVLEAADLLAQRNVHARVLSMPTVKPFDSHIVLQAAAETHQILCVEEHRAPGVIFSSVALLLAQHQVHCAAMGLNLGEGIVQTAYEQNTYLGLAGLDSKAIAEQAIRLIKQLPQM
jgi:transketolase